MTQKQVEKWYMILNSKLLEHNGELTVKVIEQQNQLISTKQQYSQKLLELFNENKKLKQKQPQILGIPRDYTVCITSIIVFIGYKAWGIYTS